MRLFIGLSLPDHISSHLSTLRGSLSGVYWNDPDTYHIPLCFIGEIKNYNLINDLELSLEKINFLSFELIIRGVNHFISPTYEDNLFASVIPSSSLIQLKKKIDQVVYRFDIQLKKRRFIPHITLAKGLGLNETQIANWLYTYNLFKTEPFKISQFSLFSSYPEENKPHYITEANYLLR